MQESRERRQAMLAFYDRHTAGEVAAFDRLVCCHPATLVIGTALGERVRE